MVGCSGDEFASILRALGFRLERRQVKADSGTGKPAAMPAVDGEPLEATATAEATVTPEQAATVEATGEPETTAAMAPPPEPAFDEIWRPGKRKEPHRAPRTAAKSPRHDRARERTTERGKGGPRQPRRGQGPGQGQAQAEAQRQAAEQRQAKRERAAAAMESSPFAALKELRATLVARGRSESS